MYDYGLSTVKSNSIVLLLVDLWCDAKGCRRWRGLMMRQQGRTQELTSRKRLNRAELKLDAHASKLLLHKNNA